MIEIAIDEKACVGCALCVDYCSTGVFSFNEEKCVAETVKAKECFGCLGCAEICPATAIEHRGVTLSEAYYHDPRALKLASGIPADSLKALNLPGAAEQWDKALTDLGVRLLSVAAVFRQTLGSGLPAVGTLAGRTLASRLPRYRPCNSLEEAIRLAGEEFSPAWEVDAETEGDDKLTIRVNGCFVRDLCGKENIPLGGELCTLFFYYLSGYIGKMGNARLRLMNAERGSGQCVYQIRIY
ncbi:MAG TPA: 4Fe-4S dicluster domain-containing protein [Geobacteraceae bacterium]|nr:4Fe-4S dicluster domain-containing protein [Geobacteraceae bacterium]